MYINMGLDHQHQAFNQLHVRDRRLISLPHMPPFENRKFFFPASDPNAYVETVGLERWHELMDSPSSVLIDTRNTYESQIGYFKGAIKPCVGTFRDSLIVIKNMIQGCEHRPILLYCTGGIRCFPASSYLAHHGFTNIYLLQGGILTYARTAAQRKIPSRYIGKVFTFDHRMGERVTDDVLTKCRSCGIPYDQYSNCKSLTCDRLMILCETCAVKMKSTCSESCLQDLVRGVQ